MDELSLQGTGDNVQLQQLASLADMEAAGFYDGSVALKVSNLSGEPMVLSSGQALSANATYLIHVKEKSSTELLEINAPRFLKQDQNSFELDAVVGSAKPFPLATKVTLIAPDGTETGARFLNGKVVFDEPLYTVGADKGFYEVNLTTLVSVNGKAVKRSIKVPFVNTQKTAEMTALTLNSEASVNLSVFEAGRFNVTATLQGLDANGNWKRLQTVDVAQWLEQDQAMVLPFELEKFSGYQKLQVVDVKLMDQSRLMPLQFEATL
jgi:hypothetical protein